MSSLATSQGQESRMLTNQTTVFKRGRSSEVTWCIAKPSSESAKLNQNIEYSCKQAGVDCRSVASGGNCCHPDTAVSRASFAMNLYYKAMGKHAWDCHFDGTGLIISQNPCEPC